MAEINYGNKNIKNQNLKNLYKTYTDHIINFEKHAEKMHNDWVIDLNSRNLILQKLDHMIKTMIKIYNMNLIKIYKDANNQLESDILSDNKDTLENYETVHKNIYDGIKLIEKFEKNNGNQNNPFKDIRNELITLSENNGFNSIDDFFKLYISEQYPYLFDKDNIQLINLYNKVFVPINIKIEKNIQKKQTNFVVQKTESNCDSLIGNTCIISITIDNLSTKITFDGYIMSDILNAYLRTSQIYSKHLFNIRTESKNIIKKSYPQIDSVFLTKYSKLTNCCIYFIYSPKELVDKIVRDYNYYIEITSKNLNMIMKEFVHNDVEGMFSIINILLMGNEQNISTAGLLFNLLKDKKISAETLSDII